MARTERYWYWQRQSPRQGRQPPLLVFNQRSRSGATRQTNQQLASQAKQLIVPTFADFS
jgi:hypothetical protein